MFNSVFLFIMLLAFKHTHLIPDSEVFPCIFLDLLSFCPPIVFFDSPPFFEQQRRPITMQIDTMEAAYAVHTHKTRFIVGEHLAGLFRPSRLSTTNESRRVSIADSHVLHDSVRHMARFVRYVSRIARIYCNYLIQSLLAKHYRKSPYSTPWNVV